MCAKVARPDIPAKVRNTGRVRSQLGIGDDHVENRLRAGCDLIPHSDGIEQSAAGRDDRGRARIAAGPRRQRRIGDDNRNIGAETLTQRQRQRQSRKRSAADDNASLCRHTEPCLPASRNYTCYLIIAGRNRAAKQGSTSPRPSFRALARTRNLEMTGSGLRLAPE
jgi:hypothetical protein